MLGAVLIVSSVAQVRLGIRVASTSQVLAGSDITYLGVKRMPVGTDTTFSYGNIAGRVVEGDQRLFVYANTIQVTMTVASAASTTVFTVGSGEAANIANGDRINIVRAANSCTSESRIVQSKSGDQITVTAALGATPVAGDVVYRSGGNLLELEDDGDTYGADYTTAERLTLVNNWGDAWRGKRMSWAVNGDCRNPMPGFFETGIFWSDDTEMLYSTYADSYNVSGIPDWGLVGITLDDAGTDATTAYGPWRLRVETEGAVSNYGPRRMQQFSVKPGTSTILGSGGPISGLASSPWGPNLHGGCDIPDEATPSGFSEDDIDCLDRYVDHYNPTNILGGEITSGVLKSFTRTFQIPVWEPFSAHNTINPNTHSNVASWQELDAITGNVWIDNGGKKAVIFAGVLTGSAIQDIEDCDAGHTTYVNSGLHEAFFTSVTGEFAAFDVMTGGTSNATAVLNSLHGTNQWEVQVLTGTFTEGETVTIPGGKSGTLDDLRTRANCYHGCEPLLSVTGPFTTARYPAFIIYDPAELERVKNGDVAEYDIEPEEIIDTGVVTKPLTESGAVFGGIYHNATTKRLYAVALGANVGDGFQSLIHTWQYDDTLPPAPFPVLPLAAGVAAWSLGGLLKRPRVVS